MSGGHPPAERIIHASAVAVDGRAALVFGPSGSGKSGLALALIALGAALVADDRVCLQPRDGALCLAAPRAIAGQIEARGIGLLTLPYVADAKAVLAIDMGLAPDARLPQPITRSVEGLALPLIRGKGVPSLASVVWLLLQRSGTELVDPDRCRTTEGRTKTNS